MISKSTKWIVASAVVIGVATSAAAQPPVDPNAPPKPKWVLSDTGPCIFASTGPGQYIMGTRYVLTSDGMISNWCSIIPVKHCDPDSSKVISGEDAQCPVNLAGGGNGSGGGSQAGSGGGGAGGGSSGGTDHASTDPIKPVAGCPWAPTSNGAREQVPTIAGNAECAPTREMIAEALGECSGYPPLLPAGTKHMRPHITTGYDERVARLMYALAVVVEATPKGPARNHLQRVADELVLQATVQDENALAIFHERVQPDVVTGRKLHELGMIALDLAADRLTAKFPEWRRAGKPVAKDTLIADIEKMLERLQPPSLSNLIKPYVDNPDMNHGCAYNDLLKISASELGLRGSGSTY